MRLYITILLLTLFSFTQAQQRVTLEITGDAILENELPQEMLFAFPTFENATLVFKNAYEHHTRININLFSGDLLFLTTQGQPLVLNNPEEVQRVVVDDEVWIPVEGTFGEVIHREGANSLLRVRRTRVTDQRKEAGFGLYSSTASVSSSTSYISSNTGQFSETKPVNEYDFETTDKFKVITPRGIYTADQNGFTKAFRVRRKFVKDFAKTNFVEYNKEADLIKLMNAVIEEKK